MLGMGSDIVGECFVLVRVDGKEQLVTASPRTEGRFLRVLGLGAMVLTNIAFL